MNYVNIWPSLTIELNMFGSNKKLQFNVSHQVVVRTELRVFFPQKGKSPFYIPCFPKYSFVKFWEMYITVKIFQHMGNVQAVSSRMLECFLMNEWMSSYNNISNNNSTVGIIALVIIEMCMLWLVKDCVSAIIISHKVITAGVLNFKMAASHFCRFFWGSDKCYSRKFSFKGHKRCYSEFCKTLFKSFFSD